jgi:hypothetical protein
LTFGEEKERREYSAKKRLQKDRKCKKFNLETGNPHLQVICAVDCGGRAACEEDSDSKLKNKYQRIQRAKIWHKLAKTMGIIR